VHYESFKNFTASIQSIITSVALVGGGVWAYWRFVLNRESAHKVDVDVDVTFVLKQGDNWIIEGVASVKNPGNSISRNRSGERGITLVGRQTSIDASLVTKKEKVRSSQWVRFATERTSYWSRYGQAVTAV
jgi:hypothetical protein